MRRLFILAIVALLGLVSLGVPPASAQEPGEDQAWVNVGPPEKGASKKELEDFLGAPANGNVPDRLSAYRVRFFQQFAFVPDVENSEFMIIIVTSGEFVLDVFDETLVVDPIEPRQIEILNALPGVPAPDVVTYEPSGKVLTDMNDIPCMSACTVLPGTPVRLFAGDRIVAPAGHRCYYCLLNGTSGELLVYPLLRPGSEFSWILSREGTGAPIPEGFHRQGDGAAPSGFIGWAYNPAGAKCGGG